MKTVLVTGSTSGIGRATAILFAKNGYKVIVHGRDEIRGQKVAQEVNGTFIKADLTNPAEVKAMFSKIKSLDVLVNNAGGVTGVDGFFKTKTEDLVKSFSTNFFGAFYCAQEAITIMNSGAIVNVGSVCGLGSNPVGESESIPVYSAAKAALHNFNQNLAKILAPKIRVNLVIPGFTRTSTWGAKIKLIVAVKGLVNQSLLKRFNTPEEIADVIYMLATNEAMTGSQVVIDAGIQLK